MKLRYVAYGTTADGKHGFLTDTMLVTAAGAARRLERMAEAYDGTALASIETRAYAPGQSDEAVDEIKAGLRSRCEKVTHYVGDLRQVLAFVWEAA